jgi:hypothetical protein
MSRNVWYSQLFDSGGDGVMLVLPYEALAHWGGSDDENYDAVIDQCSLFHFEPLGTTYGFFVGDFDGEGVIQSHWMRLDDSPDLMLVAWSTWSDPDRPGVNEFANRAARDWIRREDPRQQWLEKRLRQHDLEWQQHDQVQVVDSGILLLLHAEGPARKARFAKPDALAKCGQVVPAGLSPGRYFIETKEIEELPDGDHLCALCRWIPVDAV